MKKVAENAIKIATDPFGNYAITEIVTQWPTDVCDPIFNAIKSHLVDLCNQKYSSNVVECCFKLAPMHTRSEYIHELSGSERLLNLIKNGFGNYVVQSTLKIAEPGPDKDLLIEAIKTCIIQIKDKNIRTKWEQICKQASFPQTNPS